MNRGRAEPRSEGAICVDVHVCMCVDLSVCVCLYDVCVLYHHCSVNLRGNETNKQSNICVIVYLRMCVCVCLGVRL